MADMHSPPTLFNRRQIGAAAAGLLAAGAMSSAWTHAAAAEPAEPVWTKLPTEPFRGKQDDIHFISPTTGWYGNGSGKLFRTSDGGDSWSLAHEAPGTFIRAIGFVDATTGYIGNVGTGYYPGVTDTQPLYRTTDGGTSWTPVVAPDIGKVAGICGIDILPVRRVYQGELRPGHIIHAAGRVGGPAAILSSHDDGAHWAVQDLSGQIGMILDIKFLTERLGFLCAASDPDVTKAEALMLRTTDGGATWQEVYRSHRPFETIWKMSWPSATTGYATVQSYNPDPANTHRVIIKTVDGGASWQEIPLVEAPGVQQFGIGFVDDRHGWVGCTAGGYETRDGGASWTPVAFGRAVNKLRIVRAPGLTRVFAIGVDVQRLDIPG